MTTAPHTPRRSLPLIGAPGHSERPGRDAMTCLYRCGNACAHPVPNQSDNEYFGDLVTAQVSRRGLFRAGAVGAVVAGVTASAAPAMAAPAASGQAAAGAGPAAAAAGNGSAASGSALTFTTIAPNQLDNLVVPNGYDSAVVIRWGDPVVPGAPAFDPRRQTAAAQAKQFGYNNDYVGILPLDRSGRRALLVANHEYTNENLMFPDWAGVDTATDEQLRIAIAAHGMSVVQIERVGDTGQWVVSRGRRLPYNRRITPSTTFVMTGPAAGSPLLRTKADPKGRYVSGTLNNCAGGLTPWGTVLSGEENFNQYFVGGKSTTADAAALRRYGIVTDTDYPADNRRWDRVEKRFDLVAEPNEVNRFGWIVEVDPYDPRSAPRKHTALGRFKHEGANIRLADDGRAVAYMGDDERFDYLYKFVSDKKMRTGNSPAARAHNRTLLESGTLYVAKLGFTSAGEIDGKGALPSDGAFNGTGTWIPLVRGKESLVKDFTVEQVLINTRLAADTVGATKMDRPEDVEPNPVSGKVYVALTNNTNRGGTGRAPADEANPRNNNKHGHILEITEAGNDAAATTFTWDLPLVAGDPKDPSTYFAGYDRDKVSPISCPDNLAFDRAGNLWIATDGNALGPAGTTETYNDGFFAMPLSGPERGRVRQFLSVPVGAEACGPFITEDQRSIFTAVQHPGEKTGASFDKPASTWPDGDYAKPSVTVTWRIRGNPRIGA